MESRRKIATALVVISVISVLTGCSSKPAEDQTKSSSSPITQGAAGVSPSPSIASTSTASTTLSPSATPSSQPSGTPGVTAKPQPTVAAKAPSIATPEDAKQIIAARAKEAITAMKNKDIAKLASLVHPQKGVQFSPYFYIRPATDVQVQGSNLAVLWASTALTHWGTHDGSGDPIDLTLPNYWAKFVYNADFAAAPYISYNTVLGKGNMINNIFSLYPATSNITVEYHFPGFDPQFDGMDWTSLLLVFSYSGSQWYLVAIVHDQHTI